MKTSLLAAAVLALLAPAAPAFELETMTLAALRAQPSPAAVAQSAGAASPETKTFTLSVAGSCDAGPFVVATWCPAAGPGVKGGIERKLSVKAGDVVEIRLVNPAGLPDYQHGIGAHSFQLTAADPIESCGAKKPCSEFGLSPRVELGSQTVVRFTVTRAGSYKYYDALWLSGYGVLEVLP